MFFKTIYEFEYIIHFLNKNNYYVLHLLKIYISNWYLNK